jgi:mannose-6-phosphate isomerase-like protein (cupin superfamily)
MHDVTDEKHWHEPGKNKNAGYGAWKRPNTPYDDFMDAQDIPIYRAIGVNKVQDLTLKPWKRMGGRGAFIQLFGTEGLWGCYVIEVPAAGALNVERHLYEEIFLVIEGRGSTEVWNDGQTKPAHFEWQRGSLFSVPMNTQHRIINASSSPALILVGTTAPNMMNLLRNTDVIFNTPATFRDRYDGSADYFKSHDDIEADPLRGLAMRKTNIISDVFNTDLYLDNRRSPGYKRVEPRMAGNVFYQFIGEHENGVYSKAHAHASAAVLICIKGKGYTYTWPVELGVTPWKDGNADKVIRQDYEGVGMVSAAPMNGDWFHQHFGTSEEPLRLLAWYGPNNHRAHKAGLPGQKAIDEGAIDIKDGGTAVPYYDEDPFIRAEYLETLAREGVTSRMSDDLFVKPPEGE